MQKLIVLLFLVITFGSSAQKILPQKVFKSRNTSPGIHHFVKSISPSTAILLIRRQQNIFSRRLPVDSSLVSAYGIITKNNLQYVNAFIAVNRRFKVSDIIPYGFIPGTTTATMITGLVPLNQIETIANLANIEYFSTGEKAVPALDSARISTRANLVHQGYQLPQSYMGDGVVMGNYS